MSIIKSNLKKSFKILLDSNDASSFTGSHFNALYSIDLTKILADPEDFKKAYNCTVSFRSRQGASGTTGLTQNTVYLLALDFQKGFTALSSTQTNNIVGIVPVNNDFTTYTSTTANPYFDCKDSDNAPFMLKDLQSVVSVRLTLLLASGGFFNPTNDATVNNNTRYVCVITLKEM
jgi:hypothetical protein